MSQTLDILDFAWQIIDMQRTIDQQKNELERLMNIEKKYNDLLDSSMKHNNAMMQNLLDVYTTPGVIEICQQQRQHELGGIK